MPGSLKSGEGSWTYFPFFIYFFSYTHMFPLLIFVHDIDIFFMEDKQFN